LGVPVPSFNRQLNLHQNDVKAISNLSIPIVLLKVTLGQVDILHEIAVQQNIGEIVSQGDITWL